MTILVACAAWAQAPADACMLMSRDDFQKLTGKTEYADPTGMPWGGGMVWGFGNGQIILLTGAQFDGVIDGFLTSAETNGLAAHAGRRARRGRLRGHVQPPNPVPVPRCVRGLRRGSADGGGHRYAEEEPAKAALPRPWPSRRRSRRSSNSRSRPSPWSGGLRWDWHTGGWRPSPWQRRCPLARLPRRREVTPA